MNRAVNWLDSTTKTIEAKHPEARACARQITERLSALLLERIPADLACAMVDLLPEHQTDALCTALQRSAHSGPDPSIGHHDFVDRSTAALAFGGDCQIAENVTETFLWTVATELPDEIKAALIDVLPIELRSRMNLYASTAADSRVA